MLGRLQCAQQDPLARNFFIHLFFYFNTGAERLLEGSIIILEAYWLQPSGSFG